MKKYLLIAVLTISILNLNAQQYALFNTKTLFDAFENPAQKAFILDSSRKFASNLLLPYFDLSGLNKGNSDEALKNLINRGYSNSRLGPFDKDFEKTMYENNNIYLFSFRIFKNHKFHKEMGFSWQVRSETQINYAENKSVGTFETFGKWLTIPRVNVFNNNGKLQSYHQFSFSYRETYNKNWALGAKISLLSGIGYTEFYANNSSVNINPNTNTMRLVMDGTYRANYSNENKVKLADFLPFKNPGISISLGTTYTTKDGFHLMANLKDLGFIWWGKKSYGGDFSINETINDVTGDNADVIMRKNMQKIETGFAENKKFVSKTTAKADVSVSKTFGPYKPTLILSKNVFDDFGEAALVNTLTSGNFSISAVPAYTLQKQFKLGAQAMYQTPNFEFFMGTNDLIESYYASKEIIKNQETQLTGYHRGSVYLGIAFKIGYVVEHPMNMSWMPGVGDNKDQKSFFGKMFGIFKKKPKN